MRLAIFKGEERKKDVHAGGGGSQNGKVVL
jgi:hypothetical protein